MNSITQFLEVRCKILYFIKQKPKFMKSSRVCMSMPEKFKFL